MDKSNVRQAIAASHFSMLNSVISKERCKEGLVTIQTNDSEDSVAVVEAIHDLPGHIFFFQAYGVDDEGCNGSTFVFGGDDEFMQSSFSVWIRVVSSTYNRD